MTQRANNRKGQAILNPSLCVDDYGDLVYRCWLTNRLVWPSTYRLVGSFNAAVAGAYVCAVDSKDAEKTSRGAWDECEANCNTCRNLIRVNHKQAKDGILPGKCQTKGFHEIRFHPSDPMHMDCWKSR